MAFKLKRPFGASLLAEGKITRERTCIFLWRAIFRARLNEQPKLLQRFVPQSFAVIYDKLLNFLREKAEQTAMSSARSILIYDKVL